MTDAELDELLADCPRLFHMAEAGSWPAIRRHGLLSTSALLDLCDVAPERRPAIEAARRPAGIELQGPDGERILIRDNKPINDAALARVLDGGLVPEDWYRLLNGRVFFWLSEKRLRRLLEAGSYRAARHDVLTLDARALVEAHRDRIALSPINSGTTGRFPQRRGPETFRAIPDYPYAEWRRKRSKGERVVELTVDHGVPDVERFVLGLTRMGGGQPDEPLLT
ncbi:hypothetical protein GCM10011390_46010 [Aureimonas endophytica]|uniref:Uncharacterized protein n=1 Tax=Aureimonas endophytica TaxID=2027858 RepID=A0A917A2T7_9HYPH|nr:hypothetical protein [Aureimonas endophytica]GGE21488.1 hypothetical protein GCM10011390_46010 [Aureimonas endophytica]